ncbi:MAG: F0F1 ATP synthase subunit epsilon [Melioribacteraceae bacterium]|nr:F0F1 ATP synthase subunit epsilon [Melioribacteraceae bacterium]
MKTLKVEVITPSKKAYKGEVFSITVPGSKGNFQVLYNHAPILSSLEIGKVKIVEKEGAEPQFFAISGGTVEVLNNKVLILAESFEAKSEIDVERAENSKQRAEERISSKKKEIDLTRAEISLKRAINRLKIAKS